MWNWLRQLFAKNGRARRDPLEGWDGIHREATPGDLPDPSLDPNAPPADYTREMAAYRREEERLVRDHLGKIVLIHNDDVAGIYDDADAAILDGYKRFGPVKLLVTEVSDPNAPPDFISIFDPLDPNLEWVEKRW